MQRLINHLSVIIVMSIALTLGACGGGGGGGGSTPSPSGQTRVSGDVVKGTFTGGTATVWEITSSGTRGMELGSASIGTDGSYTVDIGIYRGAVMVEITGGTYRDEATGGAATQSEGLRALIADAPMGMISTTNVTPLTTMATELAEALLMGGDVAGAIAEANTRLSFYFDLPNIDQLVPTDLGQTSVGTLDDAARYGAICAGLSQQASDLGIEASVLIDALASDVIDSQFDGMQGGSAVSINGTPMPTDAAQAGLAAAITAFLNSNNNASGLSAADLSDLTDALTNQGDDTYFEVSTEFAPNPIEVAPQAQVSVTATTTFSDGSTQDTTGDYQYSSADSSIASTSGSLSVMGVAPGSTQLDVSDAMSNPVTSIPITVTNPVLSIAVTPNTPSIADGSTQQFTATAMRFDNTMEDVSSSVTWESSNVSIATISTSGLVTALAPGTTMIVATDAATNISGMTTLTVQAGIVSIAITPMTPSLPTGGNLQLTATATFSDSSTQDVTNNVNWSTDNSNIASVDASGQLSGVATGSTTVRAMHSGSGTSGSASVQVTDVVTSLAIAPTTPSAAAGLTQQLSAEGTFSGGGTTDLTTSVNWSSTNTSVATVSSSGEVSALSQGTTTITANDQANSLMDSVTFTVTAPIVTSISVTPSNPSVAAGMDQQFTAMATLSDNSNANITNSVDWSSSSTGVATINASGLASSASQGSTTITATNSATNVMGMTTLTVTAPVITSISISPSGNITPSTVRSLSATANLSNGGTMALTNGLTWQSSNQNAAQVTTTGYLMTRSSGSATISVSHSGSGSMGTANVNISGNAPNVSFSGDVRPIFNTTCVTCHGSNGNLSLASYSGVISGGVSGAAVSPGNGPGSLLMQRTLGLGAGGLMPQGGPPLSESNLTAILRWIDQGANNN